MRNQTICPLALLSLAGIATAQQVTMTARTDVPAVLQVAQAGLNETKTLSFGATTSSASEVTRIIPTPTGTIPFRMSLASARWIPTETGFGTEVGGSYNFTNTVFGPGGSATTSYHELVIELTAPSPREIKLEFSITFNATFGTPVPSMTVDVFDDGVYDTRTLFLSVGPQPTPIRVRCQGMASTLTESFARGSAQLNLSVTAQNNVSITSIVSGCGAISQLSQSFAHDGVELRSPFGLMPKLAVLGLASQPILLPNTRIGAPWPCLLLPRPDAILMIQPGTGYSLPIPASIRPIQLNIQTIDFLSPSHLLTGDGYFVSAY